MVYQIGYRRPPKSGRFKKGKSGNPKGRPKGSANFLAVLERELNQPVVVNENGKKTKVTRLQAMVKRMVTGALQGDQKSMLTLVAILRSTGRLDPGQAESLLPANHEELLAAFVDRQKARST